MTDVGTASVSVDFIGVIVRDGFDVVPDEAAASNNILLYLLLLAIIALVLGSKRK